MASLANKVQDRLSVQRGFSNCSSDSRMKIERAIVLNDKYSSITPDIFVLPETSLGVASPNSKQPVPTASILKI